MIRWWPKTSGKQKKPGTVLRLHRRHLDGSTFIFQQQALKSQREVKPTGKPTAMEIV